MGEYTKFSVILPIKTDTPENIKNILIDIVENSGNNLKTMELPEHEFFKDENRFYFAQCNSYYFTGTSNSKIHYNEKIGCKTDNRMILHIDCDFKNYENEIDLFLNFIAPYVDANHNTFLGYSREEKFINPELYFINNGKITSYISINFYGDDYYIECELNDTKERIIEKLEENKNVSKKQIKKAK